MFCDPIKHKRLTSMEELIELSYETGCTINRKPVFNQRKGHIAFSLPNGNAFVTPYRPDAIDVLIKAGYSRKCSLYVQYSYGEKRPEAYQWFEQIADEENWALTYDEAHKVALEKGIKSVEISGNYQYVKIPRGGYNEPYTGYHYKPLTTKFLQNHSKDNIGTYICVGETIYVVCDEYGQTFLFTAGLKVVNDFVNSLIEAGYERTLHPEWYVRSYKPMAQKEN